MPEAVDRHEPGSGNSGGAMDGSKDSGRRADGGVNKKGNPLADSGGGEGLADVASGRRAEVPASGHDEAPLDRVGGWRDAARRAARRLTAARPALADDPGTHRQDRLQDGSTAHDGGTYLEQAPRRPRGRPYSRSLELDVDWARASVFGSGLALGALIGAGVALLTAPESGSRTRRKIADVGRRAGGRAADAWDGLGDELRVVRAKTRRDVKRGLRGSRRDVAAALSDLDQRALDGLRTLRDLRRSRAKGHGQDSRD